MAVEGRGGGGGGWFKENEADRDACLVSSSGRVPDGPATHDARVAVPACRELTGPEVMDMSN